MGSEVDSQFSSRHSSAGSDVSGTAPGHSGASERGGSSRHSTHTSHSSLHSGAHPSHHSDRHSSHHSDGTSDHISEVQPVFDARSTRSKEVPLPPKSAHSAAGSLANSDHLSTHSKVKSEHSSHSKDNSVHTRQSRPRSEHHSVHLREGVDNHSICAPIRVVLLPESTQKSSESKAGSKLRKKRKPTSEPPTESE